MAYDDEVLADSPWGYWPCTDLSGLPQDASGNGRHVTSIGFQSSGGSNPDYGQPPVLLAEPAGTSIKMNLSWFVFPGLNLQDEDFTLECWLKIADLSAGLELFSQGAFGFTNWLIFTQLATDGGLVFDYWNDTLPTADGLVEVDDYVHLVFRRDHSADLSSIWLNGAKVAEGSQGGKTTGATDFNFGQLANGGCSQYVGQLAVYLSALSDARIEAHFDAGTGTPPPTFNWSVAAKSDTEAAFSVEQDPSILEIRYQITSIADTAFLSPIYDQTDAGAGRFLHTAGGLTPSTQYLARIQVRT